MASIKFLMLISYDQILPTLQALTKCLLFPKSSMAPKSKWSLCFFWTQSAVYMHHSFGSLGFLHFITFILLFVSHHLIHFLTGFPFCFLLAFLSFPFEVNKYFKKKESSVALLFCLIYIFRPKDYIFPPKRSCWPSSKNAFLKKKSLFYVLQIPGNSY